MPKVPSIPPLPLVHCGCCGMVTKQTPIKLYYNMKSGEPYNHWRFRCPQFRWWKIFKNHCNYKCDEYGDAYIFEA